MSIPTSRVQLFIASDDVCYELKSPCKNLWFEVLRRAIHDWTNGLHDPQGVKSAEREDLPDWFTSTRRSVGSFLWICETIELGDDVVQQIKTFVAHGQRWKI